VGPPSPPHREPHRRGRAPDRGRAPAALARGRAPCLLGGLAVAHRLAETEPLRRLGRVVELDDRERIRSTLFAFFHPVGTCAIGTVVDRDLHVHGVENLYVGDASVMPSIPRANTHLTVLGIAEKLAAEL